MKKDKFHHLNEPEDNHFFLLVLGLVTVAFLIVILVFSPLDEFDFGSLGARKGTQKSLAAETRIGMTKAKIVGDESNVKGKVITENDDFKIDRTKDKDSFTVTIKKAPYEDGKKKAEEWLLSNGFTQEDLCVLNISIIPNYTFGKDFWPEKSGLVPTGCPTN